MTVSLFPKRMPAWIPLAIVGPACRGRFVRLRAALPNASNIAVLNKPAAPKKVSLPKGAIGFCYAASGVLHVGFTKEFSRRELQPTSYEYAVTFGPAQATQLEIEATA